MPYADFEKPKGVPPVKEEEILVKSNRPGRRPASRFAWTDPKTGFKWCRYPRCRFYVQGKASNVNQHYLGVHLQGRVRRVRLICNFCDLSTEKKSYLEDHYLDTHRNVSSRFACPNLCKNSWLSKGRSWTHIHQYCPERTDPERRPEYLYGRKWISRAGEKRFVSMRTNSAAPTSPPEDFNFNDPILSNVESNHHSVIHDPLPPDNTNPHSSTLQIFHQPLYNPPFLPDFGGNRLAGNIGNLSYPFFDIDHVPHPGPFDLNTPSHSLVPGNSHSNPHLDSHDLNASFAPNPRDLSMGGSDWQQSHLPYEFNHLVDQNVPFPLPSQAHTSTPAGSAFNLPFLPDHSLSSFQPDRRLGPPPINVLDFSSHTPTSLPFHHFSNFQTSFAPPSFETHPNHSVAPLPTISESSLLPSSSPHSHPHPPIDHRPLPQHLVIQNSSSGHHLCDSAYTHGGQ